MASVSLKNADLALVATPTRRVLLPHLTAVSPSHAFAGASVVFAGDTFGTAFRGAARTSTWSLTARYAAHEQQLLADLLTLLRDAAASADSRLFLRTHYGQVPGLDAAQAVVVYGVTAPPQIGLYIDVSFTAEAVEFNVAA